MFDVTIRNFRHIAEFDNSFNARRTLVVGENGAAKSSVFDAIEWALTGTCRGINGKGEGGRLQIGPADERMEVTVSLPRLGTLMRSLSRTGSHTLSMKQDAVYAKLGTTEGILRAALHGERFFELDHVDGKALLMQILNVRIPPDQLPALGPLPGPLSLDELDARYQTAFDERKASKKALALLPPPAKTAAGVSVTADMVVEAKQELDRLRALERAAVAEQTRATEAIRHAEATVERLAGQQSDLQGRAASVATWTATLAQKRETLAALTTALDAHQSQWQELRAGGRVRLQQISTTITTLRGSAAGGGGCVLDAGLPCPHTGDVFADRITALQQDQAELDRKLQALERKISATERQADERRTLDREIRALEMSVAGAATVEQDLATTRASLADAQTALRDAQAARPPLQDAAQRATAAVDAQQKRVTEMDAAVQVATTTAAQQKRREKLDKDLEHLERLVTLLGPNGVRVEALTAAVGRFEAIMADALAPFGFAIQFQIDPWKVFVQVDNADPIPFVQLSRGFKVRVATAMSLAVAQLSGLGWCVIDDADTLDPRGRKAFTQLVMASEVPHVIVGMMKGDDEPVPSAPGLAVCRLRKGSQVDRLAQVG